MALKTQCLQFSLYPYTASPLLPPYLAIEPKCMQCFGLFTEYLQKPGLSSFIERLFLGLLLLLRFWRGQLERLRSPVRAGADLLPGAGAALKVAVGLCELQRLRDDALLLLVVADLGVARHGEILA